MQTILAVANMARSVYYYQVGLSKQADPHLATKTQIQVIYHRHQGRYGYRRVHLELSNQQCYLNPKTVQKLMGHLGLMTSSHKPVSSEPENRAVWLNYKMTLQTSLVGDPPAMNAV